MINGVIIIKGLREAGSKKHKCSGRTEQYSHNNESHVTGQDESLSVRKVC